MFKSDNWLKATKTPIISSCNQTTASLSKIDLMKAYVHPLTQTLLHTTENFNKKRLTPSLTDTRVSETLLGPLVRRDRICISTVPLKNK